MIFQGQATVVHNVSGPDPLATPGDVTDAQIAQLPHRAPYSDTAPEEVLLTLDSPVAGETVTVEVWALDESSTPADPNVRTPAIMVARKFYRVAAGVVLTHGQLTALTPRVGGPLYIRRTADTMAAGPGTVRAGVV